MPILNMIAQGGGGGSNVGEPTNLSASATSGTTVDIKWTDNNLQAIPPSTFQKSVLVRKVGSAPATPSDGTTVVTETVMNTYQSSAYSDTGLTDGTTYYYQVFSYSTDGGITYGTPVSATPGGGWYPGGNTVVYFPFDIDFNDYSGNGYDLTNNGGVAIESVNGVTCANFKDQTPYGLSRTTGSIITSGHYTFLAWINMDSSSGINNPRIFGGKSNWFILWNKEKRGGVYPGYGSDTGVPYSAGWHLVCFVGDTSDGSYDSYKDGVYLNSGTGTTGGRTGLVLGANESSFSLNDDKFIGQMSKVIFENKKRTAQEIADYYDQTKANYGIS